MYRGFRLIVNDVAPTPRPRTRSSRGARQQLVAVVQAGDHEGAGGQLPAQTVVDQQCADGAVCGEAVFAFAGARDLLVPDDLPRLGAEFGGAGLGFRGGGLSGLRATAIDFAPDGSLYVAQTTRGWGKGDGLQRIVWSQRTPVEIATMELTRDGFRLTFTTEMDAGKLGDVSSYRLGRFRYLYLPSGSPRTDAGIMQEHVAKKPGDGGRQPPVERPGCAVQPIGRREAEQRGDDEHVGDP